MAKEEVILEFRSVGKRRQQKDLEDLQKRVDRLRQKYQQNGQTAARASEDVTKAFTTQARQMRRNEKATTDLTRKTQRLNKSNNQLKEGFADAALNARLFFGPLDGVAARLQTMNAIMTKGNIILLAMSAAILGLVFGAAKLTGALFRLQLQMEEIEARFKFATGSAEAGADALAFVRQQAEKLGVDFLTLAEGTSTFQAAASSSNLTMFETREIIEGVATAASALALNTQDVNGIMRAFTQIISKGTVQSEELKGQIGERLPGAFSIAAKAMGVTTSELQKMLEQGEVIAEDFLPRFGRALKGAFKEGAEAETLRKNLNGIRNSLRDILEITREGARTDTGFEWLFGNVGDFSKWWRGQMAEAARMRAEMSGASRPSFNFEGPGGTGISLESIRAFERPFPSGQRESAAIAAVLGRNRRFGISRIRQKLEEEELSQTVAGYRRAAQLVQMEALGIGDTSKGRASFQSRFGRGQLATDFANSQLEAIRDAAKRRADFRRDAGNFSGIPSPAPGAGGRRFRSESQEASLRAANKLLEDNRNKLEAVRQENRRLGDQITENNLTAWEEYNEEVRQLNMLHNKGFITTETFNRAMERNNQTLAESDKWVNGLSESFDTFGDSITSAFSRGETAMESFKGALRSLTEELLNFILTAAVVDPLKEALFSGVTGFLTGGLTTGGLSGSASPGATTGGVGRVPVGFASGGSFRVGGSGGTDSQLVAFRASPSETVTVETPGQRKKKGGDTYYIDARGADQGQIKRLEEMILQINGSVERRAVRANREMSARSLKRGATDA